MRASQQADESRWKAPAGVYMSAGKQQNPAHPRQVRPVSPSQLPTQVPTSLPSHIHPLPRINQLAQGSKLPKSPASCCRAPSWSAGTDTSTPPSATCVTHPAAALPAGPVSCCCSCCVLGDSTLCWPGASAPSTPPACSARPAMPPAGPDDTGSSSAAVAESSASGSSPAGNHDNIDFRPQPRLPGVGVPAATAVAGAAAAAVPAGVSMLRLDLPAPLPCRPPLAPRPPLPPRTLLGGFALPAAAASSAAS